MNESLNEFQGVKAPAVARAVAMLDLVAREPGLGFTAIQSRLSLPKSSTHHLISTLCDLGLLKVGSDGGYAIGLRIIELAGLASTNRGLEREALPLLRSLAREVQLTCHIGILEGAEAVYLARVPYHSDIVVKSWVGKRFPLHSSALGKVLLAWLPEAERDEMIRLIQFERRMPNTITDAVSFRSHLDMIRQRGWATDDEEQAPELRCISAPICDQTGKVMAAVSAVGTITQISKDDFAILAPRICSFARDLSQTIFNK